MNYYSESIYCKILGCGDSKGVPQIGCNCKICSGNKKRNLRTRSSILISYNNTNILVDTSPDIRYQLLKNKISKINYVIFTHYHFDHICGVPELRALIKGNSTIKAFSDDKTRDELLNQHNYIFEDTSLYYPPFIELKIAESEFELDGCKIITFPQKHGNIDSLGIIFGDSICYCTDVNMFYSGTIDMIKGIDILIIDCVKYTKSISHFSFDEALEIINKISPKKAILTHMCHELDYYELKSKLPSNIVPGFDGMKLSINKFTSLVKKV